MPGFVDPHTHLVWAGDRAAEFSMRLQGKTYSVEDLIQQTKPRAWDAFIHGTTTIEIKTGYGLNLADELKQLKAILELDREVPIDLVPTFLAAHAIPPEYEAQPEAYVDLICTEMLPELLAWWGSNAEDRPLPFVDVFCEKGAFDWAFPLRFTRMNSKIWAGQPWRLNWARRPLTTW